MNRISFAVLLSLNILTLSQTSFASSDANCSAIFHSSEFSFSNRSLDTAPLSKHFINKIADQIPDEVQGDNQHPDYVRVFESWGVLMNHKISGRAFEAMKSWSAKEPHVIDIIVFRSMLQHLQETQGEPFKGDQADIVRLLSVRRLGHTLVQKFPTYYRVGVHVRSEDDLASLQGLLKFGAIAPYGIAKQTVFSRNLLMPLPESEVTELAKMRNIDHANAAWAWLRKMQEGRVSYGATEIISVWNKKHLLRLNMLVMKSHLTALQTANPNIYDGDVSSLAKKLFRGEIKVFSTRESENEIRYDLVIENPEQLEKLLGLVSFSAFHPYVALPE